MIPHDYDMGYGTGPFQTLCNEHPGEDVFPQASFRVEWGPIFHRGRLDGTARVLVIGQDPAQHENIARRVLVGEAGHRVQGFLFKLGMDRSYVVINAFLYSAANDDAIQDFKNDAQIIQYRNRWFGTLITGQNIEAVVAFGGAADTAWKKWKATPAGQAFGGAYVHVPHPTSPDRGINAADKAAKMKQMLQKWNSALNTLHSAIANPDVVRPLVLYGDAFLDAEKQEIPECDLPAGCPPWMRGRQEWAKRTGPTAAAKRATITVTVPPDFMP